jgi:hypothetical protein
MNPLNFPAYGFKSWNAKKTFAPTNKQKFKDLYLPMAVMYLSLFPINVRLLYLLGVTITVLSLSLSKANSYLP